MPEIKKLPTLFDNGKPAKELPTIAVTDFTVWVNKIIPPLMIAVEEPCDDTPTGEMIKILFHTNQSGFRIDPDEEMPDPDEGEPIEW